ncbi:MAG: DUF6455 family protein [Rhodobacterales bacterium]|nr:DUF6455 family protein [Rhodobacterales bacterium]MDX5501647.1 DUF6455 family protein [Rhodobacterales bacterium]
MIGLVEAQRAWWMAHGMARISGVHLARAVVDGWMTRSELARMVSRCEDCGRVCDCQQWLADPTHSAPPAFCGIGAEISALAGDRP